MASYDMNSSEVYTLILYLVGILTGKSYLCRSWSSPFGEYSPNTFMRAVVMLRISQTAIDVRASRDALSNIFERLDNFFRRLSVYTEVPLTAEMTDINIKIMIEVLSILAIATKEIKQGRTSE